MAEYQSIASLLESDKIYQWVNARFELFDQGNSLSCEAELMDFILEFYYNDQPDLSDSKYKNISILQVLHYLKATHQLYLTKTLPEIEQSMVSIGQRMYSKSDLLDTLVVFFNNFKIKLIDHIYMEEETFFPHIVLLNAIKEGLVNPAHSYEILKNKSISDFEDEHDHVEDDLNDVSKIIHLYSEENDIPLPFKIFLNQIEIFEMDLRKHAIIEDHVLLPMAKKLEKQLKSVNFLNDNFGPFLN